MTRRLVMVALTGALLLPATACGNQPAPTTPAPSGTGTVEATQDAINPAPSPEATLTAGPASTVSPAPTTASPLGPNSSPDIADPDAPLNTTVIKLAERLCLNFPPLSRPFEVCVAYVANSSYLARLPFYKLGTSTNPAWAKLVREHLEKRYTSNALAFLAHQTTGWPPASQLDVSPPDITVKTVNVAADVSIATLQTVETWSVRTESGQILFAESSQPHTITMIRVPSYVLHKWVVTAIT